MQQHKSVLFRLAHFTIAGLFLTLLSWFAIIFLLEVPDNTGTGLRNVLLMVQGILPIGTYILMCKTARMIYLQAYLSTTLFLAVIPLFLFFYYGLTFSPILVWGFLLIASGLAGWSGYNKSLGTLKKFEYRLLETGKYNPETGIWNVLKANPGDPEVGMGNLKVFILLVVTVAGLQLIRLLGAMIPTLGVMLVFLTALFFLLAFFRASGSGMAVCRMIRDIEIRDGVEIKV